MDAKHQQLINHCANLLDSYDADTTGLEEHLKDYLNANRVQDEDDKIFITEVFSGCVRHGPIMNLVVDGFYVRDGRYILRSLQSIGINIYVNPICKIIFKNISVLAYLALFRLDELGVAHYRKFVSTLEMKSAYKFLNFFFDEKNLVTWMKDGWNSVYEPSYVQTSLLSPILRWLPELTDLVKLMKNRIENKLKPKKSTIPATDVKPFNLTKPRPRSIPIPDKIPQLKKSNPIPASLYNPPIDQEEIARQRIENRRKAEERLMEASKIQFSCANPEKSDKTKHILQNIAIEEMAKTEVTTVKARPLPDFKKEAVPVKMTAATIMREGLLYQKLENEIMEKLRRLEAGAYDASDFNKWQSEMRQRDLEAQLMAIEERRLLGKLSHEEAIYARKNLMAENQTRVKNIKKETAAMMKEFLDKKFQEEKEMKTLVENTMASHKNAKEAKEKLKAYKRKIVQEVHEESRELMKQALEEAEDEMRAKMELIQQIRVMESMPVSRFKVLDLTSTSGAGLLGEMSILELRERLALLKAQNKEDEEIRRDNILNAKQAKAEFLSDTLDMIAKHRSEQTRGAALKLEASKKPKTGAGQFKSLALAELERKVEERRSARLQEQRPQAPTSSAAKKKISFVSQKKNLEERRWKELEQTQERAAMLFSKGQTVSAASQRLTVSTI
ncbi:unnamed protein product [Lymnaea stagnalis]|uniref:Cilia- and flagella-associated protein 99 n=1 Tax=Lymnaea stagnalis TaxID=6523 RepID=A0AAV2ILH4_LYMST